METPAIDPQKHAEADMPADFQSTRSQLSTQYSVLSTRYLVLLVVLLAFGGQATVLRAQDTVDEVQFNRDIRPILSDNCYQCHGPDQNKRQADLRLDEKQGLFGELPSGMRAIVPGKAGESELLRRIESTDPSERMPAPESGKKLKPREIALIKRWIEQGAKWQGHWAYIKPARPDAAECADERLRAERCRPLHPGPPAEGGTASRPIQPTRSRSSGGCRSI